jgi:hypothetical protein
VTSRKLSLGRLARAAGMARVGLRSGVGLLTSRDEATGPATDATAASKRAKKRRKARGSTDKPSAPSGDLNALAPPSRRN